MTLKWEYAVGAFFLLFIGGVLALVFLTLDDRNDLVVEHYYDAEIQYQQQIDRIERTRALGEQPSISVTDDGILVRFPRTFRSSDLTGMLHVYRPDDKRLDVTLPIGPDSTNAQLIPMGLLSTGSWNVQATWYAGGDGYYSEERVNISGDQR
jgi:nitrogen fixation protein FixH